MDKNKITTNPSIPNSMAAVLLEMNEEIERLKSFARNVNTFGQKIYPDLVNISEDHK